MPAFTFLHRVAKSGRHHSAKCLLAVLVSQTKDNSIKPVGGEEENADKTLDAHLNVDANSLKQ